MCISCTCAVTQKVSRFNFTHTNKLVSNNWLVCLFLSQKLAKSHIFKKDSSENSNWEMENTIGFFLNGNLPCLKTADSYFTQAKFNSLGQITQCPNLNEVF